MRDISRSFFFFWIGSPCAGSAVHSDEDRAGEAEEDGWGIGELEEAEDGRREMNGEFALAARGWGE